MGFPVSIYCSVVIIALKCTIAELQAWDRKTQRSTDERTAALPSAIVSQGKEYNKFVAELYRPSKHQHVTEIS